MWYEIDNPDKVIDDVSLEIAIKGDVNKRVFIIEGKSFCGKSTFIKNIDCERTLCVPANLIYETVFYTLDVRQNMEMILYFLTQLNLKILFIEDFDLSFAHGDATLELFANIVLWLSKQYKVVLTGINISNDCRTFLDLLPDKNRHFKYTDRKSLEV